MNQVDNQFAGQLSKPRPEEKRIIVEHGPLKQHQTVVVTPKTTSTEILAQCQLPPGIHMLMDGDTHLTGSVYDRVKSGQRLTVLSTGLRDPLGVVVNQDKGFGK